MPTPHLYSMGQIRVMDPIMSKLEIMEEIGLTPAAMATEQSPYWQTKKAKKATIRRTIVRRFHRAILKKIMLSEWLLRISLPGAGIQFLAKMENRALKNITWKKRVHLNPVRAMPLLRLTMPNRYSLHLGSLQRDMLGARVSNHTVVKHTMNSSKEAIQEIP